MRCSVKTLNQDEKSGVFRNEFSQISLFGRTTIRVDVKIYSEL